MLKKCPKGRAIITFLEAPILGQGPELENFTWNKILFFICVWEGRVKTGIILIRDYSWLPIINCREISVFSDTASQNMLPLAIAHITKIVINSICPLKKTTFL